MIVDQERKVIYLHNPKCGGTFLRDIYIEKYGKTDATKWWKLFSHQYGVDLGHITYDDLPRFIPEWKDYRIITMIRNPYNRFYSGIKELKSQLVPFELFSIKCSGHLIDEEWLSLNKFQKTYEFLRNKRIPWITPQSYYMAEKIELLWYESEDDWEKLLDIFGLSAYKERLKIAKDYAIPDAICGMIEKLYPEDRELFSMYGDK